MSAASPAVETFQLVKQFGNFVAVDHINLRVNRGSFFGFLGPNGAGKSTTIKMLTGLLAPTSGTLRVLDLDLSAQPMEVKRRIGVVPEDLNLFERLTGAEMLSFTGRMYGLHTEEIRQRSKELLELMELQDEPRKLIIEYSHGMKKKLALASALLANPDLLFLDEPFEGVDAVTSRIIRDTLKGYVERGSTVFLTSHVLDVVEKLCSHVGIIVKGQLVEQASLDEIRQGSSLEERFLKKVGADAEMGHKLSWLEDVAT